MPTFWELISTAGGPFWSPPWGFLQLPQAPPEVAPLSRWLDSWAGVGIVVDGMIRQAYDVALTRHGDTEPAWRALFYPAAFIHVARAGSAWANTPWRAVQGAAWGALQSLPRAPRRPAVPREPPLPPA